MTCSKLLALACAAGLSTVPIAIVHAADPPSVAARPGAITSDAQTFVDKVAVGNLFEIESSKLAAGRTQSTAVRSFASLMVSDHTAAGAKLRQAAADAKLTMPPEKLDAAHQAMLDDLKGKDGAAFDKAYVDAQHKGHVDTVALFQTYAEDGDSARLKQLAGELLPTLRGHLDQITRIRASQLDAGGPTPGSASRSDSSTR